MRASGKAVSLSRLPKRVANDGRRDCDAANEEARELGAELPGVRAGVAKPELAGVMEKGES